MCINLKLHLMQLYEEFEAFCNRLDKELEKEIERQIVFINNLTNALIELSLEKYPDIRKYRNRFIRDLSNVAHRYAVDINETLDYFLYNDGEENINQLRRIKNPDWKVSKKEKQPSELLQKTLVQKKDDGHKSFETGKSGHRADNTDLMSRCYQKTKKIIWHHYPEIFDFSSHAIRYIDSMAYITMTEYVENFYFLAGPYMEK